MIVPLSADLTPLLRTCVGRRNDYAVQLDSGLYARAFALLTLDVLLTHLAGGHTIGSYVINERGFCRFALFDADEAGGLLRLLDLQHTLAASGIPAYLEGSRRGGHLWVFLAALYPPALVRRWLQPYCPPGIEFYPKQETASWQHPGSLVRLPLGIHRRAGRRFPFLQEQAGQLVPTARTLRDALTWLATVERATVPAHLRQPLASPVEHLPAKKNILQNPAGLTTPVAPALSIRDWCHAQDPLAVIGRYVDLRPDGLGCCPFGWHHDDGVDTHPSFRVYVPRPPDTACWYCHTWRAGGSLFEFLALYYQLDKRVLWHRILRGDHF